MYLSDDLKLTPALSNQQISATAVNGNSLDVSGYDGVLCLINFGAIAGSAVTSITAEHSANNSSWAAITGLSIPVTDVYDNKWKFIDLQNPTKQYVRCVVTSDGVVEVGSAVYVQYNGRSRPSTHHASVEGVEIKNPVNA